MLEHPQTGAKKHPDKSAKWLFKYTMRRDYGVQRIWTHELSC